MKNKHMKRCSLSYVIMDLQIKSTTGYYCTLIRIDTTQKTDNSNCWQICRTTGVLIRAGGNIKCHNQWEDHLAISKKNKYSLMIQPSNHTTRYLPN